LFFFHNLYEPKQHLSLLKKEAKNYPIVPQFSLWLNDNDIFYNVGLWCES